MKFFLVVDHDYLGFFYFTTFVEVKVVVFCYTKDIIKLFYKNDLTDKVTTAPTVDYLFRVKSNSKLLSNLQSDLFHEFTTKGLYLSECAFQYKGIAIYFLCTRVLKPEKDVWKNIVCYVRCLIGTKTLPLIICADGSIILEFRVNAVYAVNWDVKSHIGGT